MTAWRKEIIRAPSSAVPPTRVPSSAHARAEYGAIRPIVDEYFVSPVASSIIESGLLRDEHKALEIEVIACIPETGGGPPAGDAAP